MNNSTEHSADCTCPVCTEIQSLVRYDHAHTLTQFSDRKYYVMLGFKIVHFSKDTHGQMHVPNVMALVYLQIPLIPGDICQEGLRIDEMNTLEPCTRYYTRQAYVAGVQFVGTVDAVTYAKNEYAQKRGFLTSMVCGTFHYEVGQIASDNRYGEFPYGIYFFTNHESAIEYGRAHIQSIEIVVSRRLSTVLVGKSSPIPHQVEKRRETSTFSRFKSMKMH